MTRYWLKVQQKVHTVVCWYFTNIPRVHYLWLIYQDVTYSSGPNIIDRYISDEDKVKYLRPGYRFRIIK